MLYNLSGRLEESKNRNLKLQEEMRILKRECESLKQRYEEESHGRESERSVSTPKLLPLSPLLPYTLKIHRGIISKYVGFFFCRRETSGLLRGAPGYHRSNSQSTTKEILELKDHLVQVERTVSR